MKQMRAQHSARGACVRGWTRTAIVCAAAGSIVTTLVAIGLRPIAHIHHGVNANERWRSAEDSRSRVYHPHHGTVVLQDWKQRTLLLLGTRSLGYTTERETDAIPLARPGRDSAFQKPPPNTDDSITVIEERVGWPFPALRSIVERRHSSADQQVVGVESRGAILVVPRESPVPGRSWLALPLRPLWPGFVLNSALFAAMTFALVMLIRLGRLRRLSRRDAAGLCVWCRYNLAGLEACPECGGRCGPLKHKVLAGVIKGRRSDGPRASA
jgi:hypothetical protein